jgi:hypothetical protein
MLGRAFSEELRLVMCRWYSGQGIVARRTRYIFWICIVAGVLLFYFRHELKSPSENLIRQVDLSTTRPRADPRLHLEQWISTGPADVQEKRLPAT